MLLLFVFDNNFDLYKFAKIKRVMYILQLYFNLN